MKKFPAKTLAMFALIYLSVPRNVWAFEEVINVPGTSNVNQYVVNPIPISLNAGIFKITPVDSSFPGAFYTAYSFYSSGGPWNWEVDIVNNIDPARTLIVYDNTPAAFSYDPNTSFRNAIGGTFSLTVPETVYAGVSDSFNGDNRGGVSFLLTSVNSSGAAPEISTWAMMLLGFAGIGFAAYRRAQHKYVIVPSTAQSNHFE